MNDSERVELNELCSAAVDGKLSERELARLQEYLRGSEEARTTYVRLMQLSASLHTYASEMLSEPADARVIKSRGWDWRKWKTWIVPFAAAASVALGLWVGKLLWKRGTGSMPEVMAESVARVTGEKDCEWVGVPVDGGDDLTAGQRIELKRGNVEVTFDSGASLVITGPAALRVKSAWEAEVERGTVRANVPLEAMGFCLAHAAVDVIDYGPEFSLTANGGEAEVFVHKGAVEVHPRDAAGNRRGKAILKENQARRFAKAGGGDVRDRDVKFKQLSRQVKIERSVKPYNYARWSFGEDEEAGVQTGKSGDGDNAGEFVRLEGSVSRVDGPFGPAIHFDGESSVRAELRGAMRKGVRTVAFWIRVPEEASITEAGTIAGVPLVKAWKSWLELSWNRSSGEGAFGALRADTAIGHGVGATGLRDGRWHHVAVVVGAPGKNNGRAGVKLYVDGRLQVVTSHAALKRGSDGAGAEPGDEVWLGGVPWQPARFRGDLDELVVTDRQLSPQEIRYLMRTNELLTPEAFATL